jgi:hypothetical protein
MIVNLYDSGSICIPLKHGSRFVTKHYSNKLGESVEASTRNREEWLPFVKWIVLRDPISNLKTALHTEIIENGYMDYPDKVHNLLQHHYYRPHYGNHFDIEFSKSLYESGFDFKVVELKHLSYFLYEQTDLLVKKQDASNWLPKNNDGIVSRDVFWNEFCKKYPIQSFELVELALKDMEYYNKLIEEKVYSININRIIEKFII